MVPGDEGCRDGLSLLLTRWRGGDQEALKALIPLVYAELRRLAHYRLRNRPQNASLQTTLLVNQDGTVMGTVGCCAHGRRNVSEFV